MPDPSDQSPVIDFLASGGAFETPDPVTRVDTHGACIFLCGDTALKLKRAVRYDYMDLSTPELRHKVLTRELELNAPAAPTIYRDVLPVTRDGETLRLGGDGEPLDWVLRMNRFPAEDELEAIAERGELDGALADRIGAMVSDYHAAAPVRDADGATLIRDILDELDRVFAEFADAEGTDALPEWRTAARQAFDRVAPLLSDRSRNGHVRRCHGDLHLRNIVLIDGEPVPFDALEFDETLGTCDVLYDLAFLVMDMGHRGLAEAACRTLSRYLLDAHGKEDAGLAAFPLFLSLRAAIRAMVLLQTDVAKETPDASAQEIEAYLGEAVAALAPAPPRLIANGGFSGTGKTILARSLAAGIGARPGAIHLSTDAERKAARDVQMTEHLSQDAYTDTARGAVYERLFARAEVILKAGYSVVIDGTFLDPEKRLEVERFGQRMGIPVTGLWLSAPPEFLRARVAGRTGDASDADTGVLDRQLARGTGDIDWREVDASGTPEATLTRARALLDEEDQGPP